MQEIETKFVKTYNHCMSFLSADKALARASTFVLQSTPVLSCTFDSNLMYAYSGFRSFALSQFAELAISGLKGRTLLIDESADDHFGKFMIRLV